MGGVACSIVNLPDSMPAASHGPDPSAPYNRLVTVGLTRLSGVINSRHGLGNTALKHPDQVTAWMAVFDVTASFITRARVKENILSCRKIKTRKHIY